MFGGRFWGGFFFGRRYWGDGGDLAPPEPVIPEAPAITLKIQGWNLIINDGGNM